MITTPLDSYAIDVLVGAGKVHGFRVMLGCDYRLEASIGLDETAAPCPEERQLKITLTSGRPDEGYFVSLHLGEAAAVGLRDLLNRFFESERGFQGWKTRN